VQYLSHNLQILFNVPASRTQDYELVKIAEIVRSPDGRGGQLVAHYIPPCVTIRSSDTLWRMVDKISQDVRAKGDELRRYQIGQGAELSTGDMSLLVMRQTLNRYTPLLHHYVELGDVHPVIVYSALRQLVGELSTFSDAVSALGAQADGEVLPPYNHDQLGWCFHSATTRAKELLDQLTASPVEDIQLPHDGQQYFTANLDPELFTADNRFYLAISSDLNPNELYHLLQRTGKITALQEMPAIRQYALFGLKIDVLQTPPEELRMLARYRYFQIDRTPLANPDADHWLKIQRHRSIAVFCKELAPTTDIRLVVVYDKQQRSRRRAGR
jgi:type VI secretion system protein ImpJ